VAKCDGGDPEAITLSKSVADRCLFLEGRMDRIKSEGFDCFNFQPTSYYIRGCGIGGVKVRLLFPVHGQVVNADPNNS
jgi:hypothetical protein